MLREVHTGRVSETAPVSQTTTEDSTVACAKQAEAAATIPDQRAHPVMLRHSKSIRQMMREGEIFKSSSISVTVAEPKLYEPNILANASEHLRNEALPLFYCDNNFVLHINAYDIGALQPWLERAEFFRKDDGVRELGGGEDGECLGSVTLTTDGVPHWENLVQWFRLTHAGKVVTLDDANCHDDNAQTRLVKGAFDIIMTRKDDPWEKIERDLPCIRRILAAADDGWLRSPELTDGRTTEVEQSSDINLTPKRSRKRPIDNLESLHKKLSHKKSRLDEGPEDADAFGTKHTFYTAPDMQTTETCDPYHTHHNSPTGPTPFRPAEEEGH